MPPIREHKSASPISQHRQNPSSSGEDDVENLSPKRKLRLIKASSLEQYLQHIVQAYNIALGFDWNYSNASSLNIQKSWVM
ncbi:unnamed protein product [Rhizophagus irregularis]|nr:unnamed protein product [Rhizophagus irregularis]